MDGGEDEDDVGLTGLALLRTGEDEDEDEIVVAEEGPPDGGKRDGGPNERGPRLLLLLELMLVWLLA